MYVVVIYCVFYFKYCYYDSVLLKIFGIIYHDLGARLTNVPAQIILN